MTINRIFFLSLLYFCCVTTTNLHSNDNYLQTWQTSYIDNMTPQELQMTTNIIFNLLANSVIEEKMRQFCTPIARLNQSIRTNIDTYKNPSEDLATLKTLIERLSFVTSTRSIYNQTLSTCCAHYNQHTAAVIDNALAALQLYAQSILRAWADEKADETSQQLKKCAESIANSVQYFQGTTQLHNQMSEGIMPVEATPENEENKSLIVLSIILQSYPELFAATENVTLALNETSDHAAQIIHAGVKIYKEFYTILYNKLMSLGDSRYTTTLFSMYGLLPEEYKSVLPHPDHVFEHMLQTTKLYTQTEFSQP